MAVVASTMLGTFGKAMIVVGVAISSFGLISGDVLNSSRLPYAAARDGLLPKFLSRIHPRYAPPMWPYYFMQELDLFFPFRVDFASWQYWLVQQCLSYTSG